MKWSDGTRPLPGTPAPVRSRPSARLLLVPVPAPAPSDRRFLSGARTTGSLRTCPRGRGVSRLLVSRIRRRSLDPDVTPLEMFVLPDRSDLLHALDAEATGREGPAAVGRAGRDDHAGVPYRETADAVRDCKRRIGPSVRRFARD